MKSILRGLYAGAIIPWERRNPNSEQQRDILRKLENEACYFLTKLPPSDHERFETLSQLQSELSIIGEERLFSYAFTLGMC